MERVFKEIIGGQPKEGRDAGVVLEFIKAQLCGRGNSEIMKLWGSRVSSGRDKNNDWRGIMNDCRWRALKKSHYVSVVGKTGRWEATAARWLRDSDRQRRGELRSAAKSSQNTEDGKCRRCNRKQGVEQYLSWSVLANPDLRGRCDWILYRYPWPTNCWSPGSGVSRQLEHGSWKTSRNAAS